MAERIQKQKSIKVGTIQLGDKTYLIKNTTSFPGGRQVSELIDEDGNLVEMITEFET